ncbi:MAG: hypothetical protein RBS39_02860 [Phycisphaerales bacterium]|jgi:hypothetical protein|nr:hypothetical protein [Phycisphaerales bacterium]
MSGATNNRGTFSLRDAAIGGAAALVMGAMLLQPTTTTAQPTRTTSVRDDDSPSGGGLVSAADQRKLMIAELRSMSRRLEKLEARIDKGIDVRVTDMPEVRVQQKSD